jgi:hypothetical protein
MMIFRTLPALDCECFKTSLDREITHLHKEEEVVSRAGLANMLAAVPPFTNFDPRVQPEPRHKLRASNGFQGSKLQ